MSEVRRVVLENRFRKLDDLALDVLGEAIARTSVDDFIAAYERSHGIR